ncbi:MAG TPA: hypothetical protein VHE35_15075 [Kofleriaceae bacterium]|nr:hypothetical protein [Kofleriaceae bacterium]
MLDAVRDATRAGDAIADDAPVIDAPVVALTDATVDAPVDGAIDGPIDGAIDGAIDAAVDAPIDAAVDAPTDARSSTSGGTDTPVDASSHDAATDARSSSSVGTDASPSDASSSVGTDAPLADAGLFDAGPPDASLPPAALAPLGPLNIIGYNDVGSIQAVPGDTGGGVFLCNNDGIAPDGHSYIVRAFRNGAHRGVQTRPLWCDDVAAIDHDHVAASQMVQGPFQPQRGRFTRADFAAMTLSSVDLASENDPTRAYRIQGFSGGFLVGGVAGPPGAPAWTRSVVWRLDDSGAVVATHSSPYGGATGLLVLPAAGGVTRYVRLDDPRTVSTVELATGAVVDTVTVPLDSIHQLALGRTGPIAIGEVGGVLGVVPLGSSVPTIVPEVANGWPIAVDNEHRVVAATSGEAGHTINVYRIDDARFDGVDGQSRLDPSLGPGGHIRLALEMACQFPIPPGCSPDGYHPYFVDALGFDAQDELVVAGQFYAIYPTDTAAVLGWFALPP